MNQRACLLYFKIQAALASVIMTAVLFSVDHHIVAPMWRASSECLDYLDYLDYPDYLIIFIILSILIILIILIIMIIVALMWRASSEYVKHT